MPTVSYLTVGGETLAETLGGAERDYLPDPLGSVAALLDASQARTMEGACSKKFPAGMIPGATA